MTEPCGVGERGSVPRERRSSGGKGALLQHCSSKAQALVQALLDEPEPEPEPEPKKIKEQILLSKDKPSSFVFISKPDDSRSSLSDDCESVGNYYLQNEKARTANTLQTARKNQLSPEFKERVAANDGDAAKAKIDIRNAINEMLKSDFHNARGEQQRQSRSTLGIIFRSTIPI